MMDEGVDGTGSDDCALASTAIAFILQFAVLSDLLRLVTCLLCIMVYMRSLAAQPALTELSLVLLICLVKAYLNQIQAKKA